MTYPFGELATLAAKHADLTFTLFAFIAAGMTLNAIAFFVDRKEMSIAVFVRHFVHIEDYINHSTKIDFYLFLIYKLTNRIVGVLSIAVTASIVSLAGRLPTEKIVYISHYNNTEITLIGVFIFIFTDLGLYCGHSLQHNILDLWEFHKVHHSATSLTPATNYRFHPLENIINGVMAGSFMAIPMSAAQYLGEITTIELLAVAGIANIAGNMLVLGALHHSHFKISFGILDFVFMSPAMHQLHHSVEQKHWGKNLGVHLSIWDFCFGTGVMAEGGELIIFGLGSKSEDMSYRSLWRCTAGPFVSVANRLRETWRAGKTPLERRADIPAQFD